MKRRMMSLLLCLLLMPALALGAARMPEMRGSVTDAANVLSGETAADLAAYAQRAEEKTGLKMYVAIVHFLDGMDAQSYANELLEGWELDDDAMLLLGAAGEDGFATALGSEAAKKLGKANVESLMYTSSQFGALFRAQRYDEAFTAYCTALNALISKELDVKIRMDGLFGQSGASGTQTAQSYTSELWNEVMTAITDSSETDSDRYERHAREEHGLTAGGWIVLLVLAVILFRQNRRDHRQERRGGGCLSWIFGLFGWKLLHNLLHGKRR